MSTYTLKSIVQRGSMLGVAVAVLAATIIPSLAFADALNPLTERSLLLSSSAPGYQNSDGAGNSEDAPNSIGENYAPAGSGPNGEKTGEVFTFKVSSDSTTRKIKAFTLQYCTAAAGKCQAPGNNDGDARTKVPITGEPNDAANADTTDPLLWTTVGAPNDREANGSDPAKADLDVHIDGDTAVEGTDYSVYVEGVLQTGWELTTENVEDLTHTDGPLGRLTGKQNFITLTNADTGGTTAATPIAGDEIKIVFKASETQYITNPGDDAFFVKINTYDTDDTDLHIPTVPAEVNPNIIDGGVTVANVMTDSIHITTKVLETMSFSVGTQNRDTVVLSNPDVHGTCDPILQPNDNRLQLGNPDAEYSLETDTTYDVYSYWRLSSNSSGGATVYYSGNTLANTVGDEIAEMGPTASSSTQGTEQFGLAFVDAAANDTFDPAFSNGSTGLVDVNSRYKLPTLLLTDDPTDIYLEPAEEYADGEGDINAPSSAAFAFEKESNTIPRVIAENDSMVISCATAKMRYIANIGADTPAGVYTTKINYLAAPQY